MSFFLGTLMGAAYVLPPGPVTVETVRRSLRGGVRSALAVQLGAVAGDMCYALLVLMGIGRYLLDAQVRLWLGLLGAALLIYMGLSAMRSRYTVEAQPHAAPGQLHHALGAGMMLALLNPYALVFWLSLSTSLDGSLTLFAGFAVGSLIASVLTALVVGQLRTGRLAWIAGLVWGLCGGLLTSIGLHLGYTTLTTWLAGAPV